MDIGLSTALRLLRNAYDYPGAHISPRATFRNPGGIALTPKIFGFLQPAANGPTTDTGLDAFHNSVLTSSVASDTFLGCASVIYWGFITFSPNLARHRVDRFAGLLPGHVGATKFSTFGAMKAARSSIAAGRWGDALGWLHTVSQLRQLPFASKAIAFLDPVHAGVYDNRINNFLRSNSLGNALFLGGARPVHRGLMTNAGVGAVVVQVFYQRWCLRLQQLRDALNNDNVTWICTERVRQRWRAVDVERAIFRLAANPANPFLQVPVDAVDVETEASTGGSVVLVRGSGSDRMQIDLPEVLRKLTDFFENQPSV
jgi:hypothetical protein